MSNSSVAERVVAIVGRRRWMHGEIQEALVDRINLPNVLDDYFPDTFGILTKHAKDHNVRAHEEVDPDNPTRWRIIKYYSERHDWFVVAQVLPESKIVDAAHGDILLVADVYVQEIPRNREYPQREEWWQRIEVRLQPESRAIPLAWFPQAARVRPAD